MVRILKGERMGARDKLVLPKGVSSIDARSFLEVGRAGQNNNWFQIGKRAN